MHAKSGRLRHQDETLESTSMNDPATRRPGVAGRRWRHYALYAPVTANKFSNILTSLKQIKPMKTERLGIMLQYDLLTWPKQSLKK